MAKNTLPRSFALAVAIVLAVPTGLDVGLGASVAIGATPAIIGVTPGAILIADTTGNRVVLVPSGGGVQTTVVMGLLHPDDVAVDATGDVFIANTNDNQVEELPTSGPQTSIGFGLSQPHGLAVDGVGDLFIADTGNNRVVEVPVGGGQTTVPVTVTDPTKVAVDAAGDVFVADSSMNQIVELPGDGEAQRTISTNPNTPNGLAVDAAGDLFIAESVPPSGSQVVELPIGGGSQTTVGTGLNNPHGVAIDAAGDVLIADTGNSRVVEVPAGGGSQTTVGTGLAGPDGVAVDAPPPTFSADTPVATATAGAPYSYVYEVDTPDGEPAATFSIASGALPPGVHLDQSTGVLFGTPTTPGTYTFTTETENAANGSLAPPATITVTPAGVAAPGAVYIADTNNGRIVELPAGGGVQTTVGLNLSSPAGVAVDAAGNVFIADIGFDQLVEEPTGGGAQTMIGSGLKFPEGVATDGGGDVFVADTNNNRVVELPTGGGSQTTVDTDLSLPLGVAVDAAGDLFVADLGNDRVVEVPTGGGAQTTVGTGLDEPAGVAVDAAGDVYIADSNNNRVVEVPAGGGAQTTVGTGLNEPQGVALDAAGDVFIADTGNNRVVEVPAGGGSQNTVGTGLNLPEGIAVDAPAPTFSADSPHSTATVGTAYSYSYGAVTPDGEPAATFSVSSAALPPGLHLNPTTGVLAGTPTAAGTYTFTAETENVANGTLASPATITVGKASQLVTYTSTAPASPVVGATYSPSATGGASGNPVTFSIDPTTTNSACSINGSTITFNHAGSCVIAANQAGNANYTAAPTVTQQMTVGKGSQLVTFTSTAPSNAKVAGTYNVTASGGASGNPVTFSVDPSTTNSACSINSSTITFNHPGSCVIDGKQAGNANYTAAPTATQQMTVGKGSQLVSFTSTAPAGPTVGGTYTVSATGGASGNPVTFSIDASTTNSACSISESTVDFDNAGSCIIDADQAGDSDYSAAATVTQQITVGSKGSQLVTFTSTAPTSPVVGGTYTVSATGGASGNPVTFSIDPSTTNSACSINGSTITFKHPGNCVIDANQAGNGTYTAAPTATQQTTVGKAPQLVTFTSTPPNNAAVAGSYTVSATGGASGNPVTFSIDPSTTNSACSISESTVDFDNAGSCIIDADQAGDSDYSAAATATQQISVSLALSITTVSVQPTTITATVAAVASGGGTPTGTVAFSVDGTESGTAPLQGGVATLSYQVPGGMTHEVAAVYSGDSNFAGSSASTSRSDPSITATVTSAEAITTYGWYRSAVTVTFHCTTHGAPLTGACPAAVTLSTSAAGQSVARSITSTDGGAATAVVSGINIDLVKPTVSVSGVHNHARYNGAAPTALCTAVDTLSGIASCQIKQTVASHATVRLVHYTATATDRAGNTASLRGSYRVLTFFVAGVHYTGGAFDVKSGHTYTVGVVSKTQPRYYKPRPSHAAKSKPSVKGPLMTNVGHDLWTTEIKITARMRHHTLWNIGVKTGHKLLVVKIRL
jgi:sugar lactone lactonase YvrE